MGEPADQAAKSEHKENHNDKWTQSVLSKLGGHTGLWWCNSHNRPRNDVRFKRCSLCCPIGRGLRRGPSKRRRTRHGGAFRARERREATDEPANEGHHPKIALAWARSLRVEGISFQCVATSHVPSSCSCITFLSGLGFVGDSVTQMLIGVYDKDGSCRDDTLAVRPIVAVHSSLSLLFGGAR